MVHDLHARIFFETQLAKLDTDERLYLQVPFIDEDDVEELASAIARSWSSTAQADAAE